MSRLGELIYQLLMFSLLVLVAPIVFLAHALLGDSGGKDGVGDILSMVCGIFWHVMHMSRWAYVLPLLVILLLMKLAAWYFIDKQRAPKLALVAWVVILTTYLGSGFLSHKKAREQNNREEDFVKVAARDRAETTFPELKDVGFDETTKRWGFKYGEKKADLSTEGEAHCLGRDGSLELKASRGTASDTVAALCADDGAGNLILWLPDESRRTFFAVPRDKAKVSVHGAW